MEKLTFDYPANQIVPRRAHVGVVGSGDLEVLIEPSIDGGYSRKIFDLLI